jgi:hypothetical protein
MYSLSSGACGRTLARVKQKYRTKKLQSDKLLTTLGPEMEKAVFLTTLHF